MIKIEVNEGKIPWIVGIVTVLFGILYGVLCALYPDKSVNRGMVYYLFTYAVAVIIIFTGIWLCLDAKNRKLIVEDAALCYVNSFGKKRTFALSEIAYCSTAMENGGNRDYLKLYNSNKEKLCKLEYNMPGCIMFLQYLIDNQVKIECSEKSDFALKAMLGMTSIPYEAVGTAVSDAYKDAKELIRKWIEENKEFGVEWKMGIVTYLEDELSEKKQLWEQTSFSMAPSEAGVHGEDDNCAGNGLNSLPEGYIIAIEGYLLKDGQFVINKKNRAVCFFVPVVCVSKSLKINEELKISNNKEASDELSAQLAVLAEELPKNRYHTEALILNHELKDSL